MQIQSRHAFDLPGAGRVQEFVLDNGRGLSANVLTWGATLAACRFPDREGRHENLVLSFPDRSGFESNPPYFGATCGRFANRIARGRFVLNDTTWQLATNNGPNHLHGGNVGFNRRAWAVVGQETDESHVAVTLEYVSPDGEEGFPGELTVNVTFEVDVESQLTIRYEARTTRETVLNLTNHAYWNLGGTEQDVRLVTGHLLQLESDHYLPVDSTQIPIGQAASVRGTPMDFTSLHPISDAFLDVDGGYDHCYVVRGEPGELRRAAQVVDPVSGRSMEVLTTEPGIQLYTGNFLDGTTACGGFSAQQGLCLECQHFPDSPNQPQFPATNLLPGAVYRQTTVHRFTVT